jgi:hypothetical protein
VIPDALELHRVITASLRELLETARLEVQAGVVDDAQIERTRSRFSTNVISPVAGVSLPAFSARRRPPNMAAAARSSAYRGQSPI